MAVNAFFFQTSNAVMQVAEQNRPGLAKATVAGRNKRHAGRGFVNLFQNDANWASLLEDERTVVEE